MQTESNWPIRVGGEYVAKSGTSIYRRITAIDDGEVHYMVCSRGGASSDDFPGEISASNFRRLHYPEDQSPLPELIEALTAMRSFMWSEGYADQNEAMAKADAALAIATASEPVPEEVAA